MKAKPLGSEFQVNSYTSDDQSLPAVASNSASNFVVVWQSQKQDDSRLGIYARLYGSSSRSEFQVNTETTGNQSTPATAIDLNGNFVVVWASDRQDGSGTGIYAQQYTSKGNPFGSEFRINSSTNGDQIDPAVAKAANGNFVVTWSSDGNGDDDEDNDSSRSGVYARRFDSSGAPQGKDVLVNTTTKSDQEDPAIAMTPVGNYVIVWESRNQDEDGWGIFGQRYNSAGNPLGSEFQINNYTDDDQTNPTVAISPSGDFVVAWQSEDQDGDGEEIYARRYKANGQPRGDEFRVNQSTDGDQVTPAIGMDAEGNFVVTWASDGEDAKEVDVFARRFNAAGKAITDDFKVNSHTKQDQTTPAVAVEPGGNFVFAWDSQEQDDDGNGIFGQRYGRESSLPSDGIQGDDDDNTLQGTSGKDQISGLGGDDFLNGKEGNDQLDGGDDKDTLQGGKGNDDLEGGTGQDSLVGGNGKDTLAGGSGKDTLKGGAGNDVFEIGPSAGYEQISDFGNTKDRLLLLDGLQFSNLSVRKDGDNTVITFGDDKIAFLKNIQPNQITKADFIFS